MLIINAHKPEQALSSTTLHLQLSAFQYLRNGFTFLFSSTGEGTTDEQIKQSTHLIIAEPIIIHLLSHLKMVGLSAPADAMASADITFLPH